MSDTLFGKEVSGTSLETRGLATDVARQFQNLIRSPEAGASRIAATFGLDPSQLGLQDFTSSILRGGAPGLEGFQEANRPFQNRAITQANNRLAGGFGTGGGRFSRNLLGAQARQTGELESRFNRDRFDFAQQRRGQDIQAMVSLFQSLPALQNASLAPLVAAGQYANPGAPIWQEGIAGDIIGAGGAIVGAAMGNPLPAISFLSDQAGGGGASGASTLRRVAPTLFGEGGGGNIFQRARFPVPGVAASTYNPAFANAFDSYGLGNPISTFR